jgi:membrane-associated phospholipid phosphatase
MNIADRVGAFDHRADITLEHIRDHRVSEVVFRTASAVGDFSLVWHAIGLAYGLGIDRNLWHVLGFSALMGIESLVVNQGIKRMFRRTRPTQSGDPRFSVRTPRTSSFPSGHASSACFAATLLTVWAGAPWAPLWFAIAAVVALSRAVVRIHHASDVVGGIVVGLALAQVALLCGAERLLS